MTASGLGAGWCGEALGKGSTAIAFEGGWLDPYMRIHVTQGDHQPVPIRCPSAHRQLDLVRSIVVDRPSDWADEARATDPDESLLVAEGIDSWNPGGVALPASVGRARRGQEKCGHGKHVPRPRRRVPSPASPRSRMRSTSALTAEFRTRACSADAVAAARKAALDSSRQVMTIAHDGEDQVGNIQAPVLIDLEGGRPSPLWAAIVHASSHRSATAGTCSSRPMVLFLV